MKLNVYSDGGARGNPGPGAIGVVIFDTDHHQIAKHKDTIGEATNNIAEYLALIAAQELAKELNGSDVCFSLDSELVVRQVTGEYRVKDEKLKRLHSVVKEGERYFQSTQYRHLPRSHEYMKKADRLVNEALDEQV